MPTLRYEATLFQRVADAIDGGQAVPAGDLRPPVDLTHALDKLHDLLHNV